MHEALESLLGVIRPRRLHDRVYEGAHPVGLGSRLFGGQVLAQGLAAVGLEDPGAPAHSLHAYFLKRGNASDPIRFEVLPIRRSRTFSTYSVTATQCEAPILHMTVSHHGAEDGPSHQIPMDEVGPPGGVPYERALLRAMTPDGFEDESTPFELPVEILGLGGIGLFSDEVNPPRAHCWLRAREALPNDPLLHQCLFAYASDYAIMAPALNPHPLSVTALHSASLDHAIWFHHAFRMDDWLLFELDSPVAAGARAVGRGLLYTRDGRLVASCVQEGLLRPLRPESRKG